MHVDFKLLANEGIRSLSPYQAGKPIEEIQSQFGLDRVIKLASNEHPLGPSPKAVLAASEALKQCHRYPDSNAHDLKTALAKHLKVSLSQLTLGTGSDNLIAYLVQCFASNTRHVIFSAYSFISYQIAAKAFNVPYHIVAANNYQIDIEKIVDAVTEKTGIIFIANPNNPTGTWLNNKAICQLLDNVPTSTLVVLDEAYAEYMQSFDDYPNSIALQKKYPNLVSLRTFSKAYGLAGLRVGYAISHPDIADLLNCIRQAFNVSSIALKAALAALSDTTHLNQGLAINQAGLTQLEKAFDNLSLDYIPSVANFITVDFKKDAQVIYQHLLRRGIITRSLLPYQMPNHLRISIGTKEDLTIFIEALNALIEEKVL